MEKQIKSTNPADNIFQSFEHFLFLMKIPFKDYKSSFQQFLFSKPTFCVSQNKTFFIFMPILLNALISKFTNPAIDEHED
jgi:hypothetical protein